MFSLRWKEKFGSFTGAGVIVVHFFPRLGSTDTVIISFKYYDEKFLINFRCFVDESLPFATIHFASNSFAFVFRYLLHFEME
jgi:hypothetical protein